jgi:hypothetical protein
MDDPRLETIVEMLFGAGPAPKRTASQQKGFAQLAAEALDASIYGPSEAGDIDESCGRTREWVAFLNAHFAEQEHAPD